jgi:hypothetical protein
VNSRQPPYRRASAAAAGLPVSPTTIGSPTAKEYRQGIQAEICSTRCESDTRP